MQMNKTTLSDGFIQTYQEKLESIIDVEHIERTRLLQKKVFNFEPVDHIPTVISYPLEENEWPNFGFEEIFNDPGKMLLHELRGVCMGAKLQDDRLYGIRANYGTGIIASMFGCETATFDHALPIGLHVDEKKLSEIIDNGVPPLDAGLMRKVYDTALYFQKTLAPYPKLSKYVEMELFDIQGIFDNASIIWGSEIFLAFYDEPEKLHTFIKIITDTISATVKEFRRITNTPIDEHGGAWNSIGAICLRDDSSINLSGEQYVEFVKPYNQKLLNELSGNIHFCGKAHQWWRELLDIPGLKAINPYQGELYNLFEMFETCESSKMPIFQWTIPLDERCQKRIRTGFSRITGFDSYEKALKAKENLYSKGHAELD